MLIQKNRIYLNSNLYDIDSIIQANTQFENKLNVDVSFSLSNQGKDKYHIIYISNNPDKGEIFNYVNAILKNEHNRTS